MNRRRLTREDAFDLRPEPPIPPTPHPPPPLSITPSTPLIPIYEIERRESRLSPWLFLSNFCLWMALTTFAILLLLLGLGVIGAKEKVCEECLQSLNNDSISWSNLTVIFNNDSVVQLYNSTWIVNQSDIYYNQTHVYLNDVTYQGDNVTFNFTHTNFYLDGNLTINHLEGDTFNFDNGTITHNLTVGGCIEASCLNITGNITTQHIDTCNGGSIRASFIRACPSENIIIEDTLDLSIGILIKPIASSINEEVVRIFYQGGIGVADAAGLITTAGFFTPIFPPGVNGHWICNPLYIDCLAILDVFGPFVHNNAIGKNYRMKISIFINNPGAPVQFCGGVIKLLRDAGIDYVQDVTIYRQGPRSMFSIDHVIPFRTLGTQFSWTANLLNIVNCATSLNVNSLTISIVTI